MTGSVLSNLILAITKGNKIERTSMSEANFGRNGRAREGSRVNMDSNASLATVPTMTHPRVLSSTRTLVVRYESNGMFGPHKILPW